MPAFDGSFVAPWGGNTAKEYATSVGQQAAMAPGQFGQSLANMYGSYNNGYGSYNQALQGLGNSYAQNYAAMAGGLGGIANALGNTWNNAQANNQAVSAAEAARQAAVSNLGTAAMASYGNVAGQGMQAWAQNQNGYQKALSDLGSSNQNATSQLGVGRYNALANLGKSGAAMSVGRDIAAALPGLAGGATGGGMGGGMGGGGYGGGGGILGDLRRDMNNNAELDALGRGYRSASSSLNSDQALARNMPRTMTQDAYSALRDFNTLNLGASSRGMDQFYDNYSRLPQSEKAGQAIPTDSLLSSLAGGYTDSANRIGGVQRDVNSGWSDNKNIYRQSTAGVNDLYNRSIGNTGFFNSPLQNQQTEFALRDGLTASRNRPDSQKMPYGPGTPYPTVEAYARATGIGAQKRR